MLLRAGAVLSASLSLVIILVGTVFDGRFNVRQGDLLLRIVPLS